MFLIKFGYVLSPIFKKLYTRIIGVSMFFHKKSPGFRRSSPISFINDDVETYIPICFAKFLLFRNLLCEVFQPKEPQYR